MSLGEFLRWPKVSELQGESQRNCKRRSYDPDDPFPLAVRLSALVSVIVKSEHDEYREALVAARRGDAEAQRRLDEMVEAKRAILTRQNGTPDAAPAEPSGHNATKTAPKHPAGTGPRGRRHAREAVA